MRFKNPLTRPSSPRPGSDPCPGPSLVPHGRSRRCRRGCRRRGGRPRSRTVGVSMVSISTITIIVIILVLPMVAIIVTAPTTSCPCFVLGLLLLPARASFLLRTIPAADAAAGATLAACQAQEGRDRGPRSSADGHEDGGRTDCHQDAEHAVDCLGRRCPHGRLLEVGKRRLMCFIVPPCRPCPCPCRALAALPLQSPIYFSTSGFRAARQGLLACWTERRGIRWGGQLHPLQRSDTGSGAGYVDTAAEVWGLLPRGLQTQTPACQKNSYPALAERYFTPIRRQHSKKMVVVDDYVVAFLLLKSGFKIACFRDRTKPI